MAERRLMAVEAVEMRTLRLRVLVSCFDGAAGARVKA